jgi:hypothetical protein
LRIYGILDISPREMLKIPFFQALILPVAMVLLCQTARADTFGDLTYEESLDGLSITITDCETTASGALVIPGTLNGKPVKTIGFKAFEFCTQITGITVPEGVTTATVSHLQV